MLYVLLREGSEILTKSEFLAKYYPTGVNCEELDEAMTWKYRLSGAWAHTHEDRVEIFVRMVTRAPFQFMCILDDDRIYVGRPPILKTDDKYIVHKC